MFFKRVLTGAALALAAGYATSVGAAPSYGVHTVGFEDKPAFSCAPGTQEDGGLSFSGGWMGCYYSPSDPADFPIVPDSTIMAIGFADVTLAETDGTVFDLLSVDLAGGVWTTPGHTTELTGYLHDGDVLTTTLELDTPFTTYALNWAGLDAVKFGMPQPGNGYVAFDNIVFRGNGEDTIPEPAEWMLMLGGLLASGYMLRRARQLAAIEA